MTETRKPETETEETANAADAGASEAGATEAGQELDPIEALQAENAELKDRMLRTMAEMENLRRRTEKELSEGRQYAVSSFARDMLGVGDNLRRALETVSDEARAAANEALGALIEGVEMTERDLLNQLEKHGVKKVDPAGEKFDPNYHQAMFEVPNPDVPNNTVVQVMQAGYKIGERVLRPAMVGVSKGGPKERKSDTGATPGATVDKTA
ncbi:MAG: nucleotide exchange factor GrpE [Stappia sp.]|uniref:nucleotide exchange factor GrpE n=1 Tax=Stappia sp. TaxID=1870903 RepID=UPI000C4D7C18|nr:nucleotide exchange factor GrpE [Stappia sp.]MAA99260.1 nucleotide exchange factor GrpE [Stappia sp.]MBM19330.1 nucleotide exchange factor GrpE [Stappia sp.]|tara:strand:- start:771 stop:1403 length:633 start_codon:yes stop_codon:yes gene_type:complete